MSGRFGMENEVMSAEPFRFKSKIRVAISGVCNLRCQYCDNSHGHSPERIIAMEDFRRTPLSAGCIGVQDYIGILQCFFRCGFRRVDFTGGEPMLNPAWDVLVEETKRIGFESVEMTTNGTLLGEYLDRKGALPAGLDRLIVSIDTYDPEQYRLYVGGGASLDRIVEAVRRAKAANEKLKMTANCVLTKSKRISLPEYASFAQRAGFDSVTFLDVVVRDSANEKEIDFFQREFLSGREIKADIARLYGSLQVSGGRHDYNVVLPGGLHVGVVDTQGLTRRDAACAGCERFCQEGLYTAKVATDGNITDCLGSGGIAIDGAAALRDGRLDDEIRRIYERLANGKQGYFFDDFLRFIGSQRA